MKHEEGCELQHDPAHGECTCGAEQMREFALWRDDPHGPYKSAVARADAAEQRIAALEGAFTKIDAIRNSIIAHQSVNWSAHIYPLVEALHDAGFDGEGYEIAKAKAETLHQRIATLEAMLQEARTWIPVPPAAMVLDGKLHQAKTMLDKIDAALAQPVGGGSRQPCPDCGDAGTVRGGSVGTVEPCRNPVHAPEVR